MSAGRLVRDHRRDSATGVGTVGRDRAEVIREVIGQIESSALDDRSRELLPLLREELAEASR